MHRCDIAQLAVSFCQLLRGFRKTVGGRNCRGSLRRRRSSSARKAWQ